MIDILATIVVNLSTKQMILPNGEVIPVAIGKPTTPSPTGCYTIKRKVLFPNGTDKGFYGKMGIELSNGYGVHGTNDQNSIGKAVSGGCIRIGIENEMKVFEQITMFSEVCIYE